MNTTSSTANTQNIDLHIQGALLIMNKAYPKIAWEELAQTIRVSLRNLDNVIDVNFYTTKESKNANQKHRPVGLGVMGWQDMAHQLDISLESDEAVELSDKLFEFISYISIDESSNLAKEKGAYESFEGSKWQKGIFPLDSMKDYSKKRGVEMTNDFSSSLDWQTLKEKVKQTGLRNSQQLAIAPTRSISYIAGTSASIEPWDSNIFTEVGMTGKYQMINENLVLELQELDLWTEEIVEKITIYDGSIQFIPEIPQDIKNKYKTAWEIHPKWLIAANARRQKWVDMAISFNMWLPNNNGKDAERLYTELWKAGIKTSYYLHSKSKTQSQKTATSNNISDNLFNEKVKETPKIQAKVQNLVKEESISKAISPEKIDMEIKPESDESDFAVKALNDLGEIKAGQVCDMTDPDCEACQ